MKFDDKMEYRRNNRKNCGRIMPILYLILEYIILIIIGGIFYKLYGNIDLISIVTFSVLFFIFILKIVKYLKVIDRQRYHCDKHLFKNNNIKDW